MALQISTFTNDDESSPAHRNGFVSVDGNGVHANFHFGNCYGCDRDGAESQARLFVAAPDLLAAAKQILDALTGCTGELRSAQHALARAIAKAEGV
ncbi:MAG: hypothetical protein HOQ37_16415 [Cupriavidus sp.]|nr:hypothetical protein [Cupriavidus sp.]